MEGTPDRDNPTLKQFQSVRGKCCFSTRLVHVHDAIFDVSGNGTGENRPGQDVDSRFHQGKQLIEEGLDLSGGCHVHARSLYESMQRIAWQRTTATLKNRPNSLIQKHHISQHAVKLSQRTWTIAGSIETVVLQAVMSVLLVRQSVTQ